VKRIALLLSMAALVASPPLARADEPAAVSAADKEKSRAAFQRGVAQLKAQDWAAARASFEEAWSLVPHPSILLNLGISRLKTDDPVLAEQDLTRFLAEDTGASPDEQASAKEALAEARAKLGTVHVAATPSFAKIALDGKIVTSADSRVLAGPHVVTAEAEGFAPDRKNVDVPAKGDVRVTFALAAKPNEAVSAPPATTVAPREATSPVPPPRRTTRKIVGYSLAGVSAAALVTSGIFGYRAINFSNDYVDRESEGFQNPDTKARGENARTFADVMLVGGILAGTAAVILLFTNVGAPKRVAVTR